MSQKRRILITGATGNVGRCLVEALQTQAKGFQPVLAVRNVERARATFSDAAALTFVRFDFEDTTTFAEAFLKIDTLFLLRPPHLTDVDKVFRPLLKAARRSQIRRVIFLSVQGVEQSRLIPHHGIEKLIGELGFEAVYLRPGYFMQNLTDTLLPDIRQHQKIYLPAGNLPFNWIDVQDIARAAVAVLQDFTRWQGAALTLTGQEQKNFEEVAGLLREITGEPIRYKADNPITFFIRKKKEGLSTAFIFVMIALHWLPRFQQQPPLTETYHQVTGKAPTTLKAFLEREKQTFVAEK